MPPQEYGFDETEEDECRPEMITIPAGTTFYHGTSYEFAGSDIYGPAWFSMSKAVAEHFTGWNQGDGDPVIHVYRLSRDLELPLINTGNELDELLGAYGIDHCSASEMAEGVSSSPLAGWHIPHNYPNGDDTLIDDVSSLEYVETLEITRAPRP